MLSTNITKLNILNYTLKFNKRQYRVHIQRKGRQSRTPTCEVMVCGLNSLARTGLPWRGLLVFACILALRMVISNIGLCRCTYNFPSNWAYKALTTGRTLNRGTHLQVLRPVRKDNVPTHNCVLRGLRYQE